MDIQKLFDENLTEKINEAIFIAEINGKIQYFSGGYDIGVRSIDHQCLYSNLELEPKIVDKLYTIICICPEQKILISSNKNFIKLKSHLLHFIKNGYKLENWG